MNNTTIEIFITKGERTIALEPCNKERDGQFIRKLTKENCYDYLNNTIGWNEDRHLQEPKFPSSQNDI